MGPRSLSLLFPWGNRSGLITQAKDTVMDQRKRLFLFLLYNILHFYFIVINVNSYFFFRFYIVSFSNIMSFHHHYHPLWG